MRREHMRRFWDARARENAYYFINNTLDYWRPDEERFWASGEETLAGLQRELGVAPAPADTVLDVGCGVGRLTRALAPRCRHVIGLDVSGEMIARARSLNGDLENVTWVQGDGRSLEGVDDAGVDLVLSYVVFQHIPDPQITLGYIRDIGRVLRPGGQAAFQVSNDPAAHVRSRYRTRPSLRWRLLTLAGRTPRGRLDPAWLGSMVELDDVRDAADAGGMDVERVEHAGTQFCLVRLRRRARLGAQAAPAPSSL
jgi:SAM-dependent methyltransferase